MIKLDKKFWFKIKEEKSFRRFILSGFLILFIFSFSNKSLAQSSTIIYFEDFRNWGDYDIYYYQSPPQYDNNWYPFPDADYWSATTGDNTTCGTTPSKTFGPSTSILGGTNSVFLGQNVGTSCLSSWIAPDQNITGGGLSGTGWIPLTPGNDVTLSASYGRSTNMSSGRFLSFQYELDDGAGLHHWDATLNLADAFIPATGTIFCHIPAGTYTGIRLYISMVNLDATTPEYHWFDNVKVEQCSGSSANLTFTSPTLTFPNPPSGCGTGCDTTTLKFTQSIPGSTNCAQSMPSGNTFTINLPSSYDASTCTGVMISSSTFSNTGYGGGELNGVVGQYFSSVISSYTATTNQVTFALPTTIYGGTDMGDVIYSGASFSVYLYGITLGNSLPSATVSVPNYSGGTNSATYTSPSYSCNTSQNYSLNTGSGYPQFGFTMSNSNGCASANYCFNQRTTTGVDCKAQINSGYTFTITLPPGTDATSITGCITIGTVTGGSNCPVSCTNPITSYSASGNVFTFTSPVTIPVNTQFQITLNNVINANAASGASATVSAVNQSGGVDSTNAYSITTTSCTVVNYTFASTSTSLCNDLRCTGTYSSYSLTQSTGSNSGEKINAGQTFTVTFPPGTDLSKVTGVTYNGNTASGITTSSNVLTFTTPIAVAASTSFTIIVSYVSYLSGTGGTITTSVPNSAGGTTTGSNTFTTTACPAATSVTFTSPTLTLSTTAGCTKANYTFSQSIGATKAAAIAAGAIVTVTFPTTSPAVDLSTITGVTFNGTAVTPTINSGAGTVTFTVSSVGIYCPSTSFTIVISGITNPTTYSTISTNASVSVPNISGGTDSYSLYNFSTTTCPVFSSTSSVVCNNLICSKGTYTLTQTTGSATSEKINAGATFTIVFPAGTSFANLTSITYNGTTVSVFNTSGAPTLTFTTPVVVNAGSTFSIVLSYIGNPSPAATYYISTSVLNSGGSITASQSNSYGFTTASCASSSSNFTSAGLALSTTSGCTKANYTFTQTISGASSTIASGASDTITFTGSPAVDLTTITSIIFNGVTISSGWTVIGNKLIFPAPTAVNCPGAFAIVVNGITNPSTSTSVTGTASVSIVNNTGGTDSHSSPISFTTGSCCSADGCTCPTNNSDGTCATCNSSTSGCTYTDATYSGQTLGSGQTLCITGGATYSGSVSFSGGKVVVGTGSFFNPTNSPITLNIATGSIEIQSGGTSTIHGITSNIGNVTINNCGTLNLDGDLDANIGTFNINNNGTINSTRDLNFSIAGTLCNGKNATATFRNWNLAISNNSLINNGTVNLTGNLSQSISNMTLCQSSKFYVKGNVTISIGKIKAPGSSPDSCGYIQVKGTSTCSICTLTGYMTFCDSSGAHTGFDNNGLGTFGSGVSTNCLCNGHVLPLPIELLVFRGHAEDNKVRLQWVTASEINNDYFTVLKSPNSTDFTELTRVNGAGNSNTNKSYDAVDWEPYERVTYYRLKQTDYDGTTAESKTIAVIMNGSGNMKFLYFYPDNEARTLKFGIYSENQNLSIQVTDMLGRIVDTKDIQSEFTTFEGSISTAKMAAGVYLLHITDGERFVVNKFTVE